MSCDTLLAHEFPDILNLNAKPNFDQQPAGVIRLPHHH
jgi:hypothetical protein